MFHDEMQRDHHPDAMIDCPQASQPKRARRDIPAATPSGPRGQDNCTVRSETNGPTIALPPRETTPSEIRTRNAPQRNTAAKATPSEGCGCSRMGKSGHKCLAFCEAIGCNGSCGLTGEHQMRRFHATKDGLRARAGNYTDGWRKRRGDLPILRP
eukprot:Hpha_TRINITY_DN9244_c0_g1::TRINITY_DN9244_c0_g1_i2::g.28672::m.28672